MIYVKDHAAHCRMAREIIIISYEGNSNEKRTSGLIVLDKVTENDFYSSFGLS